MSERIPTTLKSLVVPIDSLSPYAANPRNGDIEGIADSLRHHGQYRPIVVRKGTREILAGNHTYAAAMSLGWTEIAATFVDCDDDEAARIVLVDNRLNDTARNDDGLLVELLQALPDLDGTGYDDAALKELLDRVSAPTAGLTDPDDVPEVPGAAVTGPGDLWLLGEHRVLCGDATDAASVARLVGVGNASLLWTDPPYGVEYEGKTKAKLHIRNDDADGLESLLGGAFSACSSVLEPGSAFYIAHPAGAQCITFGHAILAAGWDVHQTLVWVKNTMVLGHADYHYRHEPIYYGWLPGPGRSGRGHHEGSVWHGDNSQASVFEVDRPSRSEAHPTMKPVELVARCIRNSSARGAKVLDPFGGSGSTLIAAHQEGRIACCMEIDPLYCDVICRRFEEFTGIVPVLEATGEAHSFVV